MAVRPGQRASEGDGRSHSKAGDVTLEQPRGGGRRKAEEEEGGRGCLASGYFVRFLVLCHRRSSFGLTDTCGVLFVCLFVCFGQEDRVTYRLRQCAHTIKTRLSESQHGSQSASVRH